jgi:hypothetical protein
MEPSSTARRILTPRTEWFFLAIIPLHFLCFYWWSAHSYYFTGDDLYYFSRQIHSLPELTARFLSVDEMYQYRPLTYVVFTFVFFPLLGTNPHSYHLTAYLFAGLNALLACACAYFWTGRKAQLAWFAAIFIILNPVQFFPSFGPTYIDQWLSSFFYFLTLLLVFRPCRYSAILAPTLLCFALLSKEHSVMLPAHALLGLAAMGLSFRDGFRRTRNLWVVLAAFVLFQLLIRDGAVFAPAGSNPNLQFNFSASRILELVKGAKPAVFYPENYEIVGRWLRLSTLVPMLAVVLLALKRNRRLALSGMAWFAISLLPVAFVQQAPFPRHYYLAVPGLAIVFACAVPSWRAMALAMPALAFVIVTNVDLYARTSWIALGAHQTKGYLQRLERMLVETGRSSFYVTNAGDAEFFWHIDGGAALPHVLGRNVTFRFADLKEPLTVDDWLHNGVNVIFAHEGTVTDAFESGQFPPPADGAGCSGVRKLIGAASCAIIFRGLPVVEGNSNVVETANRQPIFEVPEGMVTLSRTTIRIPADAGLQLKRLVRVVPESVDGVRLEIYGEHGAKFRKLASETVLPGESRELNYVIPPGEFDHAIIRVHPGPNANELGDWLLWES